MFPGMTWLLNLLIQSSELISHFFQHGSRRVLDHVEFLIWQKFRFFFPKLFFGEILSSQTEESHKIMVLVLYFRSTCRPRSLGVAVELILVREVRRHDEPHYGTVSVCLKGTAPAGSWIRQRRRRTTERRRAGGSRIELSLNENFCFQDQHCQVTGDFLFWDGGDGEQIGSECQREEVRRSGPSELRRRGGHGEPQQEYGTRRSTTRKYTIITRAAIVFCSASFSTRQLYNVLLTSLIL